MILSIWLGLVSEWVLKAVIAGWEEDDGSEIWRHLATKEHNLHCIVYEVYTASK